MKAQERTECLSCGGKIRDVVDIGGGKPVEVINLGNKEPVKAMLVLAKCVDCHLVQLKHTVNRDYLFRNYYYKSGVNSTMTDFLQGLAKKFTIMLNLKEGDVVVDIGCNDGTMLDAYPKEVHTVGFEPARNLVEEARKKASSVVNDFFSLGKYVIDAGLAKHPARLVTAMAMFYDLDDPNDFLRDVAGCLQEGGSFVVMQNYLPTMLDMNALDNVVHEHLAYYSLSTLCPMLRSNGLKPFHVTFHSINGGSFIVYAVKSKEEVEVSPELKERLRVEQMIGLNTDYPYVAFAERIRTIRSKIQGFMANEIKAGKRFYGYGASTRGNTTLRFIGLDSSKLIAIADRNPAKWGTRMCGIPVISEGEMRASRPDYLLVLPWHFMDEFIRREDEYLHSGGKFLVPLPDPYVVSYDHLPDTEKYSFKGHFGKDIQKKSKARRKSGSR